MAKSSMILKMAALAMLAGSAALPAQASLIPNALHPNAVNPNAVNPNAVNPNAVNPNGVGANSAAGRTFDASRQASGVDVNRLRLRAIVLPGEPGRPTTE